MAAFRVRLMTMLLIAMAFMPAAARAQFGGTHHMKVQLLTEADAVAPGSSVAAAFTMKPEKGWHGYWQNPGDAGVGTNVDWTLPSGFTAGTLRYPVPDRLTIAGLMNYVYEHDYALLTSLVAPADAKPGTSVPVRAKLDYLVCTDQVCVPERAEVTAQLKIGTAAGPPVRRAQFDRFRQSLPRPLASDGRFEVKNGQLRAAIPFPASIPVAQAYFFPATDGALAYSAPQAVSRNGDWLILETKPGPQPLSKISGVLKTGQGQGFTVDLKPGPVPAAGPATDGTARQGIDWSLLLTALVGAVIGGLILNVMPCVFPILSLKALSLARAGETERGARTEALAYTGGVVATCLALGGALLLLRAGGAAAGWAFQLQDPRVILFLFLLVLAIALNLAGWFELPSFGGGERLVASGGTAGAFWTGVLAAFVATPCTGPFMGAALGAALVLPGIAALAIFAGLGIGLALPFLLLGFVPALRKRLPKPGPWMVKLRYWLSVPMFLTALGLAWILSRQTGWAGLGLGLAAAILVGGALVLAGRRERRILPFTGAALATIAAVLLVPAVAAPAATSAELSGAQPFSEATLAALRQQGRPVFVYFTADWCLTCKVNEKAVLERDEVSKAFKDRDIAVLEGDWTRGDPAISRFLEAQGRSGVPLYLYYAPGKPVQVLPQILSVPLVTGLSA